MKILVTGCNGQLGHEVRNLAAGCDRHQYHFTDIDELDVCNAEAVNDFVDRNGIDCVINCAAYTAVDKAESDDALAMRLNACSPGILARAVARNNGMMVHISTDYVFDGTGHVPYREDMPVSPVSVYGRTKWIGENRALEACRRTVILRTAWLYSPYGNNFVKTMIRLGREKDSLGVVADQIGTPTYAADLAAAVFAAIDKEIAPGIYHFSDEGAISWYDFAKAIHRIAGITSCHVRPLLTEQYPTPARRPHYSVLDKSKIKRACQMEIPYWEDSLRECIARMDLLHD